MYELFLIRTVYHDSKIFKVFYFIFIIDISSSNKKLVIIVTKICQVQIIFSNTILFHKIKQLNFQGVDFVSHSFYYLEILIHSKQTILLYLRIKKSFNC